MTTDPNDVKVELQFTQAEGLQKTYAHYLLFKEDSPTLGAILNIVVPDKVELFKNIFTELNKKHVNAGLAQFAPNIPFRWNESEYGITKKQYDEMKTYGSPILSKFSLSPDKMAKEMYENKPQIDFIHEMVIQYFPKRQSTIREVGLVNNARENLRISLKEGYIGTKKAYIEETEQPFDIAELKLKITDDKQKVFDKLPNVLHLEAVAELHRHAFLSADKKDVLEVIANAHTNGAKDVSEYIPNAKSLYVKKDANGEYMVSSIQMNTAYEKYIKIGDCWKKEVKAKTQGGTKQKSKKARSK